MWEPPPVLNPRKNRSYSNGRYSRGLRCEAHHFGGKVNGNGGDFWRTPQRRPQCEAGGGCWQSETETPQRGKGTNRLEADAVYKLGINSTAQNVMLLVLLGVLVVSR